MLVFAEHAPLTMDFNSSTIQLTQVSDGSWMAYLADLDKSVTAERSRRYVTSEQTVSRL